MEHQKLVIRKECNNILNKISNKNYSSKSKLITQNLISFLFNSNSSSFKSIGVYSALKTEPKLNFLFEVLKKKNIEIAFPYFDLKIKNHRMNYKLCDVNNLCNTNDFNILLPPIKNKTIVPDILLIPGLGFDKNKGRIGRGGGYFDNYLSSFKGLKLAVCFEDQLIKSVPMEEHDQRVDFIITEKKSY